MSKTRGTQQTRRRFLSAAALAASVSAALAIGSSAFAAGSPEPIRLGCSLALTGRMASEGHQFGDGYKFMAKYINEQRGGITLNGVKHPLKLVVYDDQSETKTAVKLVEKLISEEKIDLILGPYSSGIVYATGGVIKKYNKIMLEGGGISEKIFQTYNKGKPYIFLTSPSTGLMCKPIIAWLKSVGADKLAIVTEKGEFARSMRDQQMGLIKDFNLQVVLDESAAMDARDFTPILSKIKQSRADAVLSNSHLELGVRLVKQMRDFDVNVKAIYGGAGVDEDEYQKSLGWMATGVTYYGLWDPSLNLKDPWFGNTQNFIKEWRKMYDSDPTGRKVAGASTVQVYAMAIEGANSLDPDALRSYLSKMNVENFLGNVSFDKLGKLERAAYLGQRQGKEADKLNIIYPPKAATAKAIYPRPSWKELEQQSSK